MKGYITLNLIPVEKIRRFSPAVPWVVFLVVLLLGQVGGTGWYFLYRVRPPLIASTQEADFYQQEAGRLQVNAARLHQLSSAMQETHAINAEVQAARSGVLDWTTLAGLLTKAAGGGVQIGQVTVDVGGTLNLSGTAASLPALNAFVANLAAPTFPSVAVGSVQGGSGKLQFTLTASYHWPGGGG